MVCLKVTCNVYRRCQKIISVDFIYTLYVVFDVCSIRCFHTKKNMAFLCMLFTCENCGCICIYTMIVL